MTPEVLVVGTVPSYAHPGDAGADITASESVILRPGERALVKTGVSIALPDGFVAFVMPRSGLALKHGIALVNSPGLSMRVTAERLASLCSTPIVRTIFALSPVTESRNSWSSPSFEQSLFQWQSCRELIAVPVGSVVRE